MVDKTKTPRTVYWPTVIYEKLVEIAKKKRRCVSNYVVEIAENEIKKEEKKSNV